jgi:hypothetical protein
MTTLEHQTHHVDLTTDAWWPVPDGQAFVVLKPDDPAMVILAHIGGDTAPPITSPQVFVAPAVLKIASLAPDRRVWLRASKRPGRGADRPHRQGRGTASDLRPVALQPVRDRRRHVGHLGGELREAAGRQAGGREGGPRR